MTAVTSPLEKKPLGLCMISEFLDMLASPAVLPGAGAAGGVALALAAGCACKAVTITRRHEDSPALAGLQVQLEGIMEQALVLGQQDALLFKRQLKFDDSDAATALLRTDFTLLDICSALDRLLQDHGALIAANMAGDWKAAAALLHACRVIHKENVRELKADA